MEYLFSDKTGTLTENVMIFKECSIGGVTFKDQMENLICTDNSPFKFNERSVRKFLEVLALCHTVQATKKITATKINLKILCMYQHCLFGYFVTFVLLYYIYNHIRIICHVGN